VTEVSETTDPAEAAAELARNANAMLGMITSYWVTQILRATAELSLADHVAAGASTAEQIAKLESSDSGTTFRLLRAAASLGVFAYEGDGQFSVTSLGSLLRKGVPGSLREFALSQGGPLQWQPWGLFPEAVRRGKTQLHIALDMTEGQDSFDYFAAHPDEAELFAASMSNATNMIVADVAAMVDLTGVSSAVDVGGADGALVLAMMQSSPSLRGIVLERPHAIDGSVRAAKAAGMADRFEAVGGDFFQEVPTADLYLLKMILHDWDDESCLAILRNCRASARAGARALVVESIIGKIGEPDFAAIGDMNMLAVTFGQERSAEEFDKLFTATGWRRISAKQTRTTHVIQELRAV
jgi:hypothetical protein